MSFEDYYNYFEDEEEDMFDYFDEDDMTPELADLLESYHGDRTPPVVYNRISFEELFQNCMLPTSIQMAQGLFTCLILSLVFRLAAQLRRASGNEGSIPIWMLHSASAMFGIVVLHTLFGLALLYLVVCCVLSYLLLVALASRGRYLSGVVVAVLIVIYVVFCELWLVDITTWHRVRGAQMILSMKIISLAFDYGKGSIIDLPNIFEFTGYCFHVGTVIFGPWVSYEDYYKSLLVEKLPLSLSWLGKFLSSCALAVICLVISSCLTHWLILDHAWIWLIAYRDAQSFRFSHYFVSFMSETLSVLSGVGWTSSDSVTKWTLTVSRPHVIELPPSLVDVVVNWNLPMHFWLKTYVFQAAHPLGNFAAVIFTYAASSLLHGLNFQLAAVLFSLGFYSYVEYVFRAKLSKIFNACIQARKCKDGCDHTYKRYHPCVLLVNVSFGLLVILHLAYLGLMFDSSGQEEKGYTMAHTLSKWNNLGFLSHKITLGMYIIHLLI